jgi:CRISPR/Cas system Type II protein with McrA/HNH and RuvC-like nuclease domain
LVDYLAICGWVRFIERSTSAPKLHDKIDDVNLRRGAVSQWRAALIAIQNGKCFYDASHDMAVPEVDHLIPWTYVLEDRTWNLVLACRKCNNDKSDRLTNLDAVQRLCTRNSQITEGGIHADAKFLRHFEEWESRDLSAHIQALHRQAVADRFPFWK